MVGAEQGFVRRINARATEIETFDRATLIVPNSNLVSGVVKNWVHTDRIGRIIVAINVAYESDVEAVREILIAAAKAQDLVLSIPGADRAVRRIRRLGAEVQADLLRRRRRDRRSAPAATSISTSCAACARPACASPTRRPRRQTPADEVIAAPPQAAAVRPASQPMIACLRARPQW